jgi:GTPase SAR1 family protein
MRSNIFFSKCVLCALALFGFGSATAMSRGQVVIVGESRKNAIIKRMVYGDDIINASPSTATQPVSDVIISGDNRSINARLWDTTGQYMRFPAQLSVYISMADVVVIVLNVDANTDGRSSANVLDELVGIVNTYARRDVSCIAAIAYTDMSEYSQPIFDYCSKENVPYAFVRIYSPEGTDIAVDTEDLERVICKDITNKEHNRDNSGVVYLTDGNEPREGGCCS